MSVEKIKKHISDHKVAYSIAGGVVLVSVGVVIGVKVGRTPTPTTIVSGTNNIVAGRDVLNTTVNNAVSMGGHVRKIVQNVDTGEIFSSVTDAAASVGVTVQRMSAHVNGHTEHLNGSIFRIIGLSAD